LYTILLYTISYMVFAELSLPVSMICGCLYALYTGPSLFRISARQSERPPRPLQLSTSILSISTFRSLLKTQMFPAINLFSFLKFAVVTCCLFFLSPLSLVPGHWKRPRCSLRAMWGAGGGVK